VVIRYAVIAVVVLLIVYLVSLAISKGSGGRVPMSKSFPVLAVIAAAIAVLIARRQGKKKPSG